MWSHLSALEPLRCDNERLLDGVTPAHAGEKNESQTRPSQRARNRARESRTSRTLSSAFVDRPSMEAGEFCPREVRRLIGPS
eukprot:2394430-Pyramimonas_sp.AAC.2